MLEIENTAKRSNVLLIINPVAGRRTAQLRMFKIVDTLTKNGCKTTVLTTGKKGDATEYVRSYGFDADKIICCGGDGTLNEVFTGLAAADLHIPVGYIPAGTTNDFANKFKMPLQIDKAIKTAINGKVYDHDIGKFNTDRYFSYIASFGAFTKVAYETPQWVKNTIGPASYFINGAMQLGDLRPHYAQVIADDFEITGEFIFGSVSNSTIVGGFFRFPKENISYNDGEFEVMLIKKPSTPIEAGNILQSIISRQYNEQYVHFVKAKNIKFMFKEATQWTTDGEDAGWHDGVQIENLCRRVNIIVP